MKYAMMKTSIKTIPLLAALAIGPTSPRPFHRRPISVFSTHGENANSWHSEDAGTAALIETVMNEVYK